MIAIPPADDCDPPHLIAFFSVQWQIRATRREGTKLRSHDLKSTVYIPAVKALSAGLTVAIKMADLGVPLDRVLDDYNERLPDIFAVHRSGAGHGQEVPEGASRFAGP